MSPDMLRDRFDRSGDALVVSLSALREDKRMACVDPAFRPTGNGPKKVKT